jgi:uncharacterized membrane protein YfcA
MFKLDMASYLLLIFAAFAAGLINSVAGGGSFLTFPALVFTGVPSIIANASSTLALIPGTLASAWAYRGDFKQSDGFPFWPMMIVSLAGGMVGALLLLFTPQRTFDSILPWLMLAASLLFTFGPRISPILKRVIHIGPVAVVVIQFLAGIYGGYFGGAVGIVMLAAWSLFGLTDIHFMNANRTVLGSAMNAIAVVLFVIAGKIWWPQAMAMLVAAVIGGYFGAVYARTVNPRYVRAAITVISFAITIAFFLRRH